MSESAALPLIMMAGGLFIFKHGLDEYGLKKEIELTPTSKAVAVAPGIVEVAGTARPCGKKVVSPYAKSECLYYCTELYKWEGSGRYRSRYLVKRLESTRPLYLEDETGSVLVLPTTRPAGGYSNAELKETSYREGILGQGLVGKVLSPRAGPDPNDPLYSFVKENAPDFVNYSDTLEVHETAIDEGVKLYVLGTAKLNEADAKNPEMVVWDDPSRKFFCIREGTESEALSGLGFANYYALGGPLLFLLGYWLGIAMLNAGNDYLNWGIAATALMYAWLAWTHLTAMYNCLVQLKNGIDRAGANTEALLKKRADLIPQLAEAAKAYSRYEKKIETMVAQLRSAQVGQAKGQLAAIAEAYPKLAADDNFKYLQGQMVTMENQLAASREFLNDSITLYNRQISTYPYVIFARMMGFKPVSYVP